MFPLQPQINTKIRSPCAVGYAWFFENIVIYGDGRAVIHFLHTRKAKNFGMFLGVVKGLIPVDPYQVLYQWINSKPTATIKRYLKRKAFKSLVKKMSKHQPQWKTKRQIKENTKLGIFV